MEDRIDNPYAYFNGGGRERDGIRYDDNTVCAAKLLDIAEPQAIKDMLNQTMTEHRIIDYVGGPIKAITTSSIDNYDLHDLYINYGYYTWLDRELRRQQVVTVHDRIVGRDGRTLIDRNIKVNAYTGVPIVSVDNIYTDEFGNENYYDEPELGWYDIL